MPAPGTQSIDRASFSSAWLTQAGLAVKTARGSTSMMTNQVLLLCAPSCSLVKKPALVAVLCTYTQTQRRITTLLVILSSPSLFILK